MQYQLSPKIPPCTVSGRIIFCDPFKRDDDKGTKPSPLAFLSPEIDLYDPFSMILVISDVCLDLISTSPPTEM